MRVLVSGAGFSVAWGHPVTKAIPDRLRQLVNEMPSSAISRPSLSELDNMEEWLSPNSPSELRDLVRGGVAEMRAHLEASGDEQLPGILDLILMFLDAYANSPKAAVWDYEDLLSLFKANIDGNIETVAKALEMPREAFYFPDPEFYFEALLYGLGAVLNWTGPLAREDASTGISIPPRYKEFERAYGPIDGVITLNYDMIPEYAFVRGRPIDYGISKARLVRKFEDEASTGVTGQAIHRVEAKKQSRPKDGFPVYKLHGSLNMAYCPKCSHVFTFPHGNFDSTKPLVEHAWLGTLGFHCAVHCGEPNLRSPPSTHDKLRPLMVPPLADKTGLPEIELLEEVKEAAIALVTKADELIVVGTRVRESDTILHDVLRAGAGKRVVFFGTDSEAKARLERLVGAPVEGGWDRL